MKTILVSLVLFLVVGSVVCQEMCIDDMRGDIAYFLDDDKYIVSRIPDHVIAYWFYTEHSPLMLINVNDKPVWSRMKIYSYVLSDCYVDILIVPKFSKAYPEFKRYLKK